MSDSELVMVIFAGAFKLRSLLAKSAAGVYVLSVGQYAPAVRAIATNKTNEATDVVP